MSEMMNKHAVRSLIRDSVRSHYGLLSEGTASGGSASVERYKASVTLTDAGLFSIDTSSAPSEFITLDVYLPGSEKPAYRWNAEKQGAVLSPESWTNILVPAVENAGPGIYTFVLGFGAFDDNEKVITGAVQRFQIRVTRSGGALPQPSSDVSSTDANDSESASDAEVGASGSSPDRAPTDIKKPQSAASRLSIQDKIRLGASAVNLEVRDREEPGVFDIQRLAADSPPDSDQAWVSNDPAVRAQYDLSDFSRGEGYSDEYTYFALVNTESKKPVAFVVASDPESNKHFSTGRFIGPTSDRRNLRLAFCYLYHRATGEVHESCKDGATTGPDDDVLKGAGKKRGSGSGSTGSAGGSSSGVGAGEGPGAVRLVAKDGVAARGRGDAMTGVLGISLRPAEKLRGAGYKIITKAKDKQGFTSFPEGPGKMFLRDPMMTAGGKLPPSSLGVRFKNPMAIITDESGKNPYVNFGENKSKDDIKSIVLGWGGRGIRLVKLSPGDKGFDEAAAWILQNQDEFDLRPDAVKIKDEVGAGTSPAENRSFTVGESVGRSSTPLWDRYRF